MKQIATEIEDHTKFQSSLLNLICRPHARVQRKQDYSGDLELKMPNAVEQPTTRRGRRIEH